MVLLILCWPRLGWAAKMKCKGLPGKSVSCSPASPQQSEWLYPAQFFFWSLCSKTFLFSQNTGKNKKMVSARWKWKTVHSCTVLLKFHCPASKYLHKWHLSCCTVLSYVHLPSKQIDLRACVCSVLCTGEWNRASLWNCCFSVVSTAVALLVALWGW